MKKIYEGGNTVRNLGLLLLVIHLFFFYLSATIYIFQGNSEWFSRAAVASILLGLYLIANKD